MSVTFVNLFEIPADHDDRFMELFRAVNDHMRAQPGYLGHKLHRSLAPDARYRFVNVVEWASPEHFRDAHDERFRAIVSRPEWSFAASTPALYEVVDERAAARL